MKRKKKLNSAKKMNRRTFMKTVGTVGMALSTLGFPGIVRSQKRPEEVEIGVIYPMSGPSGPFGKSGMRGWDIAVDEINEAGGIKSLGGAKLKTVLRDTESTPKTGMAETEKLVRTKIAAIVGAWNSGVTFPTTQLAEQAKVPYVVTVALMDEICRRGFKYTFRVHPEATRMEEVLVEFVDNVGKRSGAIAKKAVVLGTDDAFGRSYAKPLLACLKKFNIESVGDFYYPVKTTDLTVEIANAAALKPDVWFFHCQLNDAVLITRTLYQQRIQPLGLVANGAGFADPQYLSMLGNLGSYIAINASHHPESEIGQAFDKKMRARYNVRSDPNSAVMYITVYVLKDALERAGSTDRDRVRDALEATNITSGPVLLLSGKGVKFDGNHENVLGKNNIFQSIEGDWHTVWPYDVKKKFDPVWPRPSWEKIEKL